MINNLTILDVGFVIANDREEFLSRCDKTRHGSTVLLWSSVLLQARLFTKKRDAQRVLNAFKVDHKLWLFTLLNTPGKLVLASDDLVLPDWFSK